MIQTKAREKCKVWAFVSIQRGLEGHSQHLEILKPVFSLPSIVFC